MADAYPLQWPQGWKRSERRCSSRYRVGLDASVDKLIRELKLFGASKDTIVISSNIRTGLGRSISNDAVKDPGVAVYWVTRAYGERVLACDKYCTVHENVRAIAAAVEALRALERSGASQVLERAFSAFAALPESPEAAKARPWWEVLGFEQSMLRMLSPEVTDARYRELARKSHPDRGGTEQGMAELNRAREEARAHFAK